MSLLSDVERARHEALSVVSHLEDLYWCLSLKSQRIDDPEERKDVGHSHHGIAAAWALYKEVVGLLRDTDYGVMAYALKALFDTVCPDVVTIVGLADTNAHALAIKLGYEVMGGLPILLEEHGPPERNLPQCWKECVEQVTEYPCTKGDLNWLRAKVEKESTRARLEVESGRVESLPPSWWRLHDAPYQRREAELAASDDKPISSLTGLLGPTHLDRKELSILVALRRFRLVTMTIERIEHTLEQMGRDGEYKDVVEPITARTISDRLNRLIMSGLVVRPRGSKAGCTITKAGLTAIKALP